MNKISLYILLILLFLALSKSFSPSSQGAPYVVDERVFSNFFEGSPITVILVDSFTTGFLIKTYFLKFKIIYGFNQPQIIITRTSKSFWEKNQQNIGMSLFRRSERNQVEGVTPLPPGSLFIGDLAYGFWKNSNSGHKIWQFHRAYRHFPAILGWNSFTPTKEFFAQLELYQEQSKPYYGMKNEFGKGGHVTEEGLGQYKRDELKDKFTFKKVLEKYINIPVWSIAQESKVEQSHE